MSPFCVTCNQAYQEICQTSFSTSTLLFSAKCLFSDLTINLRQQNLVLGRISGRKEKTTHITLPVLVASKIYFLQFYCPKQTKIFSSRQNIFVFGTLCKQIIYLTFILWVFVMSLSEVIKVVTSNWV